MMVETKDGVTSGTERLNAVIAWWGLPSAAYPGAIEKSLKRWQALATELQTIFAEAYEAEMKSGVERGDRLGQSLQAFMLCRNPSDFLAAQSQLSAVLHESASHRAKRFSDVTQGVHGCCALMAREMADDFRGQHSEVEQPVDKAGKRQTSSA